MSDSATNKLTDASVAEQVASKGKGKAADHIETEDESSDEEDITTEDLPMEDEEEEEDDLAEIDTSNIIQGGRRTRGAQIDFKAAEANEMVDDDEDDDDGDFHENEDDDAMDTK